jgi:3-phosphoshikimate 1-carboxyvinyltransferase
VSSTPVRHVAPATHLAGTVTPPGAKSGTVRALLCGTLAPGTTTILNPGSGDNIRAMAAACRALGAAIEVGLSGAWLVHGIDHRLPDEVVLDAGNSGIVLRLLAAIGAATLRCTVGTAHADSLGKRGNQEIVAALRALGADAAGLGDKALPPLIVGRGAGLHGGIVPVSGRRSSQFLSGLLLLAPLIDEDVTVQVYDELPSAAMAGTTVTAMGRAGVVVEVEPDLLTYRIAGGQRYRAATHQVAADASSFGGLLASAACVPGSQVRIRGTAVGDVGAVATVEALKRMGVRIEADGADLICYGTDEVQPIQLDGSAFADSVLPIAALSAFAAGTSVFANVETLRFKECDRITDFCHELARAGVDVEERHDTIIVHGRGAVPGGAEVFGHHDHSVIMAMAVVALRSANGLAIRGWDSVGQTYRDFFDDLRALGAPVGEAPALAVPRAE